MTGLFRKLRGMCGLGAIWAAIWSPLGVGVVVAQWLLSGFGLPPWQLVVALVLSGARNGFVAGFLFGAGLSVAYRKRSFADLRPRTVGVIGAVVGVLLPAGALSATAVAGYFVPPLSMVVLSLGFTGTLGAVTAIGSLKLAQSAPERIEEGETARRLARAMPGSGQGER